MAIYGEAYKFEAIHGMSHGDTAAPIVWPCHQLIAKPGNKTAASLITQYQRGSVLHIGMHMDFLHLNFFVIVLTYSCTIMVTCPFDPYGLAHGPEHISLKLLDRFSLSEVLWIVRRVVVQHDVMMPFDTKGFAYLTNTGLPIECESLKLLHGFYLKLCGIV